jgi:hypothetical protein
MAEPVRDPETGGRSLADILREAGIENPSRGRRRRWDDPDDGGLRQRRADAEGQDTGSRPAYGRRAGDLPVDRPDEPVPSRAAGRAERPPAEAPAARADDRSRGDDRPALRDTGALGGRVRDRGRPDGGEDRRAPRGARAAAAAAPAADPSTAAIPGLRPSQKPGVPPTAATPVVAPATAAAAAPVATAPAGRGQRSAAPPRSEPATGPIPVVRPPDEGEPAPTGPGAWLRFAGELVVAAAVGVGVYFAFTVLWEMLPHLAVVASPLVVTGLVAGVGAWRQRSGRGPVGIRMLALLVFAGTVLTILPAAGLLAAA